MELKNKIGLKDSVIILLKGILMGIADTIPGVSGGTIAFITGIYDKLIYEISNIKFFKLLNLLIRFKIKQFFKELFKIDLLFLGSLALGILTSIYLGSFLIIYLLKVVPNIVYSFFFGLIIGSAIFLFEEYNLENLLSAIVGLLVGIFLSFSPIVHIHPNLVTLFFVAIIAIMAMILPGISGAFILLLLNHYTYILSAVKNLVLIKLGIFATGALIGLLSFSKVINWGLKKRRDLVISFLVGLMLGGAVLLFNRADFTKSFILNSSWALEGFFLIILFYLLPSYFSKGKLNSEV